MTEKDVLEAIEAYSQQHKVMPTKVLGTFNQLLPFSWLTGYAKVMGKDVFVTVLATLELEFDADASGWYLS